MSTVILIFGECHRWSPPLRLCPVSWDCSQRGRQGTSMCTGVRVTKISPTGQAGRINGSWSNAVKDLWRHHSWDHGEVGKRRQGCRRAKGCKQTSRREPKGPSQGDGWRTISGRGNSLYKGPEVGRSLADLGNSEEASVAGV